MTWASKLDLPVESDRIGCHTYAHIRIPTESESHSPIDDVRHARTQQDGLHSEIMTYLQSGRHSKEKREIV